MGERIADNLVALMAGQGNFYAFLNLFDALRMFPDGEEPLPVFPPADLNVLKSLLDSDRAKTCVRNNRNRVIVYQKAGGAEIPDGCSRFSIVCDEHGTSLKHLDELLRMATAKADENLPTDVILLLHTDNFTMQGEFEEESRWIYVDTRTMDTAELFELDLDELGDTSETRSGGLSAGGPSSGEPSSGGSSSEGLGEPSSEGLGEPPVKAYKPSTPSESGSEGSSDGVPNPFPDGHPSEIGELLIENHRYIILSDRSGDEKPYLFFEAKDALNRDFGFRDFDDIYSLNRLLEKQGGKTVKDRVILHHIRPHSPPEGCSRFGLVASSDGQPIKNLEELIQLTEENVDEEPTLNLIGQYGRIPKKITIDKTRPDEDERKIHEPLGLLSNRKWMCTRAFSVDRFIFFNVNEFLNENPQSVYYWLYLDLKDAKFWRHVTEGVAFWDLSVQKCGVLNTCNGEPVQALADLARICRETVEQDLRFVGQVKNEPMEVTCSKSLHWYFRPNAIV
jgi:hypothetical protein